jgi:anti-sigma B factor antagonist
MATEKTVIVMHLPERLKGDEARALLNQLKPFLEADQPRLVFDFSQVSQIDSAGVEMLLSCMEQVMKQDGDLKLAAVPPESAVILELTRVDRLFEVFPNASEAVDSFQHFPTAGTQKNSGPWYASHVPGNGKAIDDLKLTS